MAALHVKGLLTFLLAGAASAAMAQPDTGATDQQAQRDENPEIFVTAQRRAENLQEIPVAVTAFDGELLEATSATNVGDIAAQTPGLISVGGATGGNDGYYFIRGVGQGDFTAVQDPGVATYIDGVYLGRTSGANFELADIERIEVLRGPQGTLFGRNAVGGAINVITADPSGEFHVRGFVRAGSRSRLDVQATVDFPIIDDQLAGLVSVGAFTQDGYAERVIDGRTEGDIGTLAGRAKLRWTPSSTISVVLSGDYTRNDGTSDPWQLVEARETPNSPPSPFFHSPLGVALPNQTLFNITRIPGPGLNADRTDDFRTSFQSVLPVYDLTAWGVSGTVTVDFTPDIQLKSITAYRDLDQVSSADFDGTQFVFYDQVQSTVQDQFSQEVQLLGQSFDNRLDWVIGGYYYTEDVLQNNGITLGGRPFRGDYAGAVINNQLIEVEVDTYAFFGQATFAITDQLALTGGIRYSNEEKSVTYDFLIDNRSGTAVFVTGGFLPPGVIIPFNSILGQPALPPGLTIQNIFGPTARILPPGFVRTLPVTSLSDEWDAWTGRAAIEYEPNDDMLFYGSWSRGFKSGGFNSRPVVPADIVAFDPEYVETWEIGAKTDWWSNRFRFNIAGYFSQYTDRQLLITPLPVAGQPQQFFVIDNAGDVDIWGIEVESLFRPTSRLLFNATAAWSDNEYTRLTQPAVNSGLTTQSRLPQLPEWTFSLGAQWRAPLASFGDLVLRGDLSWQDDVFFGSNNSPRTLQEDYAILNLRMTLEPAGRPWRVALFGRNVTDTAYINRAQDVFDGFGVAIIGPARPSEFGIELRVDY
ncbi:MAG: TonB-dependent receptor [Allosphingosinicella sp.]